MKKRKKASTSPPRRAHGGHIPALSRAAGAARELSVRKPDPDPGPSETPQQAPIAPPTTLSLPAECTVSGAIALKEQLAGLLDEPHPVTLDIASLQRIDTAAMQVITAFVRERAGHGRAVEWQGSAPVLLTAAQLLGLTSLLKLPA